MNKQEKQVIAKIKKEYLNSVQKQLVGTLISAQLFKVFKNSIKKIIFDHVDVVAQSARKKSRKEATKQQRDSMYMSANASGSTLFEDIFTRQLEHNHKDLEDSLVKYVDMELAQTPQETKGTGKDKGMIIVSQADDDFTMMTFPKKDRKRMQGAITVSQTQYKLPAHVKKIIKEVSEEAAKAYLMRTTFFEKEGLPRKSLNEVKTFYMDILQNTADRILNHPRYISDPLFRKQAFKQDKIRVKFMKDLELVFQRQFGNFKQILYNTRTKGKTIADIYTTKKAEIAALGKTTKAQKQTRTFGRMLIDGFIPLFLSHPNTPTAVVNSIMEDFKAFLQNQTKSGPYGRSAKGSDPATLTAQKHIEDFLIPYLRDVLTLPRLGRKGVDDVIRIMRTGQRMTPKNAWVFESLAQNPITTGDQLTKMFDALSKVVPQSKSGLHYMEPAFSMIARNGKLSKSIRDKMIGIDLGIDCNPDESMNIRVALASNPNLPKKDLQTLSNDPCMSVAVVARHHLKRRFK